MQDGPLLTDHLPCHPSPQLPPLRMACIIEPCDPDIVQTTNVSLCTTVAHNALYMTAYFKSKIMSSHRTCSTILFLKSRFYEW
ncbi:hypothetical protein EI42_03817 [Thermosporothrix hazakensis]|jgi:hypothetical protein|uniref:Uncharacterized protein n=1 Tax=Thermosporothrix hazakensis TaxID=644383 RepID=A0A326U3J6_THEHA|nr:hypothetical protein EI42_03817 [Thermosporothrix hazakensis]